MRKQNKRWIPKNKNKSKNNKINNKMKKYLKI